MATKQFMNETFRLALKLLILLAFLNGCKAVSPSATTVPETLHSGSPVPSVSPVGPLRVTHTPVSETALSELTLTPTFTPTITPTSAAVSGLRLRDELSFYAGRFALSPDGTLFAVSEKASVKVLQRKSEEIVFEFMKPFSNVRSPSAIQFSPNGNFLAAYANMEVQGKRGDQGIVYVWSPSTWGLRYQFRVPYSPEADLKFSADGRYLAVASASAFEQVDLWDVQTGKVVSTLQIPCNELAFSPIQPVLATAEDLGPFEAGSVVKLWDLRQCTPTGCQLQTELYLFPDTQDRYNVASSLAFSKDGRLLAVIVNKTVHLWDLEQQKEIIWPAGAISGTPDRVAFSSQGVLAVLEREGLVTLFTPASGEKLGQVQLKPPGPYTLRHFIQFSQDGNLLITGGGSTDRVQFWAVPLNQ